MRTEEEDTAGGATGKAADQERDTVLVPVGDGAEGLAPEREEKDEGREEGKDDDRRDDREDDDREDTRMGRSEGDDDEDSDFPRRQRDYRSMTRAEKNELRRRSKERDRTEIRFLRTRNEALERQARENAQRLDRLEKAGVDEKINRLRSAVAQAEKTVIRLTAAGDEAQALEATNIKNDMQRKLDEEMARRAAARPTVERREPVEDEIVEDRRSGPPPLTRDAQRNVSEWFARNSWYDHENPGTDERVVQALDAAILAEGDLAPEDPEYYRELDRRIREYLPHRSSRRRGREDRDSRDDARDDDDRDTRRGRDRDDRGERDSRRGREDRDDDRGDQRRRPRGPTFRVGGRDRELRSNEVHLDRERRRALEDMGVLDDPVLRNRYLSAYKKYDESNPNARRRS